MISRRLFLQFFSALLLCPARAEERVARSWPVMGTYATVEIDADNAAAAAGAIEEVRAAFDRVNNSMSVYRREADIVRVNHAAGREPVAVDPWFVEVVRKGREAYLATNGAFSMNVLEPGIRLGLKPALGMPPLGSEPFPRHSDSLIVITDSSLYLPEPGMALDLGGIAKGFALDKGAEILRARGFNRFLLNLGRSVFAGDPPRERRGWSVRIENEKAPRLIANQSIAVSRQFAASNTPHIVDPGTGEPAREIGWVAVAAREGWLADMASTALFVDPKMKGCLKKLYEGILEVATARR